MDIQQLKNRAGSMREEGEALIKAADEIDAITSGLSPGTIKILGQTGGLSILPGIAPPPAGARRGVTHPNDLDKSVFAFLVGASAERRVGEIKRGISDNFPGLESPQISKSLKWLLAIGKIETNGKRGPGVAYFNKTDDTSFPTNTHTMSGRRNPDGGPTAKEAVLLVINEYEPGDTIKPKDVYERAMEIFPNRFKKTSFGAIFSTMAKKVDNDGKPIIKFEGDGKSRVYIRGVELLKGAGEYPEGFNKSDKEEESESATG